jgi:glucosyl-3-phosphoglycerate phosphatase
VPLDDIGLGQARRAARLLATFPPSLVVSSDLARATSTAAELAGLTGLPVHADARLRETDGGSWQGKLVAEIEAFDAQRFHDWRSGADVRPGGGETRGEVADRAEAAVRAWLADVPDGGVLVVATHGGTARALIGRLLALPTDHWHALGGLANCSWSVLEPAGAVSAGPPRWRLTEHNAGTLPEPVTGTDDA